MLSTEKVFMSVFSSMDRAMVHSTHLRAQPAGHGGRAGHAAGVRRRGHRRAGAAPPASCSASALDPLVERYEMLHEVRGQGPDDRPRVRPAAPRGRCAAAGTRVERIRPALFSQAIVVPLFHRHRILTQVAADNVNMIKLLPPLIAGEDEVDVLRRAPSTTSSRDAHHGPGAAVRGRARTDGPQTAPPAGSAAPDPAVAGARPARRPRRPTPWSADGRRRRLPDRRPRRPGRSSPAAAGFIGSAVVRALLLAGAPTWWPWSSRGAATANLDGLDVRRPSALDVRDRRRVRPAVARVPGPSSTWPPSTGSGRPTPTSSTTSTSAAPATCSRRAGRGRVSSGSSTPAPWPRSGSKGPAPAGRPTRRCFARVGPPLRALQADQVRGRARGAAGRGRGRAGRRWCYPTFPLGPRDSRPTPTGKVVLDFLNGRIPGFVDTAMNVAHVDDLADGPPAGPRAGPDGAELHHRRREPARCASCSTELAGRTGLPVPTRRLPRRARAGRRAGVGLRGGTGASAASPRCRGRPPGCRRPHGLRRLAGPPGARATPAAPRWRPSRARRAGTSRRATSGRPGTHGSDHRAESAGH